MDDSQPAADTRHVDDHARAALQHPRQHGEGQPHRGEEVDPHNGLHLAGSSAITGAALGDRRVVDQHVDAAERIPGLERQLAERHGVGQVGHPHLRAGRGVPAVGQHLGQPIAPTGDQPHDRALGGQLPASAAPKPDEAPVMSTPLPAAEYAIAPGCPLRQVRGNLAAPRLLYWLSINCAYDRGKHMTSTGSIRYEGDTWDLASSVGVTATMVAAARAIATRADNPLINDPFAEPLVRAVGVDLLTRLASGEVDPPIWTTITGSRSAGAMARMADNMAVRTKFFDDFFIDATKAGVRQVVILASGLDSRAYRLPWQAGTVVYEIDQPQVIEFKSRTLAELGAAPTANRRAVAVDLRDDWPAALRAAGFDPSQPTAWSAEGLLGYLPPEAQDRLLDTVTELSAPGSRFATESVTNVDPADQDKMKERMQTISERWRAHGFDIDMTGLVYFGDRNEAAPYLADHGWQLTTINARDLLVANGLPPIEDDDMPRADLFYVSGTLDKGQTEGNTGRTDGDSWGPASSVGATATMVAVSRALASQGTQALLNDPLADPLVRAVGLDPFIRMVDGEIIIEDDPLFNRQAMNEQIAVRTRFFDDFFIEPPQRVSARR